MLLQKQRIAAAVAGVALLTGMGISVKAAFAQSSTTPSTPPSSTISPVTPPATSPATSPTAPTRTTTTEKHPELRAALRYLKLAKTELQKGARDYQGERAAAVRDTDKAIADIEKALKSDRR